MSWRKAPAPLASPRNLTVDWKKNNYSRQRQAILLSKGGAIVTFYAVRRAIWNGGLDVRRGFWLGATNASLLPKAPRRGRCGEQGKNAFLAIRRAAKSPAEGETLPITVFGAPHVHLEGWIHRRCIIVRRKTPTHFHISGVN